MKNHTKIYIDMYKSDGKKDYVLQGINRFPLPVNPVSIDYLAFLRSCFVAPGVEGISNRWLLKCFDSLENRREFDNERGKVK